MSTGYPTIEYCDFYNNENGNYYNCNQYIGIDVTTNVNGNNCDMFYNIHENPLFIEPLLSNYNISSNSPCIDAGNPNSPPDPDGSIVDIGSHHSYSSLYGSINGVVSIIGGFGDIENVEIITNNMITTPNIDGSYQFTLPPGIYDITANLYGYNSYTLYDVIVYVGEETNTTIINLYSGYIWPGDTNFDGLVNESDIDNIAVYWKESGTGRDTISFIWQEYNRPLNWEEPLASLADCNGDGIVNVTDILALCLNWNKTHESSNAMLVFNVVELIDKKDAFLEIYYSLGNSEFENMIKNHIAKLFDLPIVENEITDILFNNYPNPFNPTTKICYSISEKGNVKLVIFNVKGQIVKEIRRHYQEAGQDFIIWDGLDNNYKKVSSGVYFYKLENNGNTINTKKMLLIK